MASVTKLRLTHGRWQWQSTHTGTHSWEHIRPGPESEESERGQSEVALHTHPCVDTHRWAHLVRRAEAGQWVVKFESFVT